LLPFEGQVEAGAGLIRSMGHFGLRFKWVAATLFWMFVAGMLGTQIWLLSSARGEAMEAHRVLVWQTTLSLAWIPFTVPIWQVVARWRAEDRGRAVVIGAHVVACRDRRPGPRPRCGRCDLCPRVTQRWCSPADKWCA